MRRITSVNELSQFIKNGGKRLSLIDVKMTLEDESLKDLLEAIKSSTSLKCLHLHENNIDCKIATKLSKAIACNNSIRLLSICNNNIGDEGLKALASALKLNQSIDNLSFTYNNIGNEGVQALAEVLKSRKVAYLNLYYNNSITEIGAKALDYAVQANPSVLYIYYNMKSQAAKTIFDERQEYAAKLLDLYQEKPFNEFTISELIGCDINKYAIYWLNKGFEKEDRIDFPQFEQNISNKICELYKLYTVVGFVLKQHMCMDLVNYTVCFWAQLPFTVKPAISNVLDVKIATQYEELNPSANTPLIIS